MIEVRLDKGQLAELADMIADKLRESPSDSTASNTPYSVDAAARALGRSKDTIRRRIKAGTIPTIRGLGRILIPASAIADLQDGKRPSPNRTHDQ